jgi:DNA-binding GntR family transcriptional regulator
MTDQLLTKEPTQRYLLNYLPRSLAKHKSILDAFKKYDLHELRASIDNHFIELERFYMEEYE